MKDLIIVLLCFFTLSACGQEKSTSMKKDKSMDINIKTIYLKSRVSDQIMSLSLPECVISGVSEIKQEQGKILGWGVDMRVERLAFSQPEFHLNLKCENDQNSKGASIYAIYPIDDKEKQMLQSDSFQYLLNEAISVGAVYLDSKNDMALYKIAPYRDSIFVGKNFSRILRPLSVDYIRFDSDENDSFRYYFNIETILKGEYKLKYTAIATADNPSQFAEKFRYIIEKKQNILDYPEIVAEFVENNERIADFFENQKINK